MAGKTGASGRVSAPHKRISAGSGGMPVCPEWLKGRAKAKFDQLSGALVAEFDAGEIDSDMLAVYCDAYADFAAEAEKTTGKDYKLKKEARAVLLSLAPSLGLTLKVRSQMPNKPVKDEDAFTEFEDD